jgi:hypothetical protein
MFLTLHRHTYPQEGQEEEVREGFDPDEPEAHNPERIHNLDYPFAEDGDEGEENKDRKPPINESASQWESRDYSEENERDGQPSPQPSPQYGSFREERNVWGED